MTRLFVALPLPDEAVTELDEFLADVRRPRPHLRWSHPSTWHVTLEFLGECGRFEVDRQLSRWEERATRVAPFRLHLVGGGSFPHPWSARVLWAAVGGDLDQFRRLAAPDQHPHVTVARARGGPLDLTGVVDEMSRLTGEPWRADELHVVASYLGRGTNGGPAYETLQVSRLGPPDVTLP